MKNLFLIGVTLCAIALPDPACDGSYSTMVEASGQGKLNTELLAAKYGPITTEVLSQTAKERKVWFRDKNGIARGYAVSQVLFDKAPPPALAKVHRRIVEGESMGATFKAEGFTIRKDNLKETVEPLPEDLRDTLAAAFGTRRSYQFVAVSPEGVSYPYAEVVEWTPQ